MQSSHDPITPQKPLVIQKVEGVAAGATVKAKPSALDSGNSRVYGTSVFARYDKGISVGQGKVSDDKIIIGYTLQGLPFQIVVDGFFGSDPQARQNIFKFIDERVALLVPNYVEQLSAPGRDPEALMKQFIRDIYQKRPKGKGVEFTMSLAMVYRMSASDTNYQLYCAGFGIGDTGLILRSVENPRCHPLEQLAYTTHVNRFKDAFDDSSAATPERIERVIARNSVFNVPVKEGDEIVGYTYLFYDLLREQKRYRDVYNVPSASGGKKQEGDDEVVKLRIRSDFHTYITAGREEVTSNPYFERLCDENQRVYKKRCEKACQQKGTNQFGDDCTLGSVTVPSKKLQDFLAQYVQLTASIDSLESKIEKNKSDGKNVKRYEKLHTLLQRAQKQIAQLKKSEPEDKLTDYLSAINAMMHDKAYGKDAIDHPTQPKLNKLIDLSKAAQGSPSTAWKALGIVCMAIGTIVAAIGGLVIGLNVTATVASAGIFAPVAALGLPVGIGLAAGGVGLTALGAGFFAYGCQRGLSKTLHNLWEEQKNYFANHNRGH